MANRVAVHPSWSLDMERLSQAKLPNLASPAKGPNYSRADVTPGIVHIGIGAFHRAHMAVYVDDILVNEPHWGIIGASVRSPDTKIALAPQDYLYSVTAKDADGASSRVVGSVIDIIDASQDTRSLIATISDPAIRILSLTVTEKGYCHDPASGELLSDHPDIIHDLAHPETPRSVPGIIAAALATRRARGAKGLTVLSCDNLQGNGHVAGNVVRGLAQLRDHSLAAWIADNVSFPSTMVDRIVPSTTESDRQAVDDILGLEDAWPVVTEPFSQWVIEDKFVAGRPAFETVGVQMVAEVEPFEFMKLRMLNGSHSAMAYLGLLAGYETVAQTIADPGVRTLLQTMMAEEVIPTLSVPGIDLIDYRDRLLRRFANPALQHRCAQIAMDGSQKLPQRVLMPIRERLDRRQPIQLLSLTVAAWIAHVARTVQADPADLRDPLVDRLAEAVRNSDGTAASLVRNIFAITDIFGDDLAAKPELTDAVEAHLDRLLSQGVGSAIAAALIR